MKKYKTYTNADTVLEALRKAEEAQGKLLELEESLGAVFGESSEVYKTVNEADELLDDAGNILYDLGLSADNTDMAGGFFRSWVADPAMYGPCKYCKHRVPSKNGCVLQGGKFSEDYYCNKFSEED